ncbi:helix-turn-helix domain-containing protein [Streptomyces lasiicapitis]|uniref:helix-turn-helix domain-containing protein n=1 Tax=Streptomyces lasiicapitis TaxID=1923961 RepID=UPI0036CBE366
MPNHLGSMQIVRGPTEELKGTTGWHRFGGVQVSLIEGGPHKLVRPGRLIDPTQDGYLHVCRPLSGAIWVFQDGRHGVAQEGQLICFDSTRPYKAVMPESFRMVHLLVSHRLMGVTNADARLLTAHPWPGTQGLAALVSMFLGGLDEHAGQIGTAMDLLGGSVAGLTAALFAERMSALAGGVEAARQALMLRIQTHIKERLADPELSSADVARRHNISVRYLQKLFREHGTSPARWIRGQRLARCRADLADPGFDHLPVAAIGERAGLYGPSHFSRLFRDRYGITPREFRRDRAAAG